MGMAAALVAAVAVLALAVGCCGRQGSASAVDATGAGYLFQHVDSTMGFGDKMNMYHNLLLLAQATQRTLVLPPFQIALADYSGVRGVDLHRDGEAALDAALREALPDTSPMSLNLPLRQRFVRPLDWFDKAVLEGTTGVRVISYDDWLAASGGVVDRMLLPSQQHGCIPAWLECKGVQGELEALQGLQLTRFGAPVRMRASSCVSGLPYGESGSDFKTDFAQALIRILRGYAVSSTTTLGLDGFCARFQAPPGLPLATAQAAWRFTGPVLQRARAFLAEHGIQSALAVHWRRGDVAIDHRRFFLHHTPELVVGALASLGLGPGVDGIVLLTDNFMDAELARFAGLAHHKLGLKTVRYGAGEALEQPPGFPVDHLANNVLMDLALGSVAQELACTHNGSSFCVFLKQSRRNLGNRGREHWFQLPPPPPARHEL